MSLCLNLTTKCHEYQKKRAHTQRAFCDYKIKWIRFHVKNVKHERKLISEYYWQQHVNKQTNTNTHIGIRIARMHWNGAKKPSPNNYYHHHILHIYGYFMIANRQRLIFTRPVDNRFFCSRPVR